MITGKNLLSVAGYDPSGGAGVTLDIRVIEALGFRGLGVITSVTAQDASRVRATVYLPARFVWAQYEASTESSPVAGIKAGMIGSLENLSAVARILAAHPDVPRVVDPVFCSSSGFPLLESRAVPRFLEILAGRATLITPNLDEASALAGLKVRSVADMKEAARRIAELGRMACLVKGGHLGRQAVDVLYAGGRFSLFRHGRVAKSVHGSGCFLSASVLGYLAAGRPLEKACRLGIGLTVRNIRRAVPAGRGRWVFRPTL